MGHFALVLASLPTVLIYGWAGSLLWRWFITPFGAPPITVAHAAGLFLCLGLVRLYGKERPDVETSSAADEWAWFGIKLVGLLITLGIGAVIHGLSS